MEEYTLIVMAAGLGSRFGGLKQIEPVGPNNETLIEYSVYDAIKAGFTRVIFVISKETEKYFQKNIIPKLEGKIKAEYCIQKTSDIPEGYTIKNRQKPWGSAHVIYSVRDLIKGSFAVINADDFYGPSAYESIIEFLKNNQDRTHYLTIGYKIINTLSKHGAVKRGVARQENGILTEIIESKIVTDEKGTTAHPLDGKAPFKITDDTITTVNLFAFTPNFLKAVINNFPKFLDQFGNDPEAEYLMPEIVSNEIKDKTATVYINISPDKWLGMTYKEDKETLKKQIEKLIEEGKYPAKLWE